MELELIADVFKNHTASIIAGVIMILAGLLIYRYKAHWLIAGVNSLPEKKLKQMDLDYVSRSFGLFLAGFGFLQLLITIVLEYLKVQGFMIKVHFISVFILMFVIAIFAIVKRKRINW